MSTANDLQDPVDYWTEERCMAPIVDATEETLRRAAGGAAESIHATELHDYQRLARIQRLRRHLAEEIAALAVNVGVDP